MLRILRSRWFPAGFAIAQTLRHTLLLAWNYWSVSQSERGGRVWELIRQDLSQPLFEHYSWCRAWVHYGSCQTAVLGLDLPVYLAGTVLQSVLSGEWSCVDALTTPRGNVVTIALTLPVWWLAGRGLRRLARREWRREAAGIAPRLLLYPALLLAPVGALLALLGGIGAVASGLGPANRLTATGLWLLWAGVLSAERLRVWPFEGLSTGKPGGERPSAIG